MMDRSPSRIAKRLGFTLDQLASLYHGNTLNVEVKARLCDRHGWKASGENIWRYLASINGIDWPDAEWMLEYGQTWANDRTNGTDNGTEKGDQP